MPCEEYERLVQPWKVAVEFEKRLRNGTMQLLRTMGRKEVVEARLDGRRQLVDVEARMNAHIDFCPQCRADHRKKVNLAKTQP